MDGKIIKSERNYGIDLLRLVSMFYIVILHVLGRGGVLQNAAGVNYAISWLMEIAVYCAVDCYALISGYVAYSEEEKKYKYTKYISLWSQVVFYSFGLYLLMYVMHWDNVGKEELIRSLFPVSTGYYWYFTAYTGLFFLIPWINILIRKASKRQVSILTATLLMIFSVYATLVSPWNDPFHLEEGYSFLWLTILYIVGAWMKKCKIEDKIQQWKAGVSILAGVLITWILFLKMPDYQTMFVSYINPLIVGVAIAYVIFFMKIKIGGIWKKIISFFAPAAFGVYLIHVHSLGWDCVLNARFAWLGEAGTLEMVLWTIVSAIGIFGVCIVIEKLRIGLFKGIVKLLKNKD